MRQRKCLGCSKKFIPKKESSTYCSRGCVFKYSEEHRAYIIENWGGPMTTRDIATYVGRSPDVICKAVNSWRDAGAEIPERPKKVRAQQTRNLPVGSVRYRMLGSIKYKMVKTEHDWEYTPVNVSEDYTPRRAADTRAKRKTSTKERISQKTNSEQADARVLERKQKLERSRYPTRTIDISKLMPVYIPEQKMTVYVKQGTDPNATRERYNQHRKQTIYGR